MIRVRDAVPSIPRPTVCQPFTLFLRYMVTNERFAEFVGNTSHVTTSEKYGWSFVFLLMLSEQQNREITQVRARYIVCGDGGEGADIRVNDG